MLENIEQVAAQLRILFESLHQGRIRSHAFEEMFEGPQPASAGSRWRLPMRAPGLFHSMIGSDYWPRAAGLLGCRGRISVFSFRDLRRERVVNRLLGMNDALVYGDHLLQMRVELRQ